MTDKNDTIAALAQKYAQAARDTVIVRYILGRFENTDYLPTAAHVVSAMDTDMGTANRCLDKARQQIFLGDSQ